VKGYKVILVMPESMSIERRALLKHLGAEIVLTPADQGMAASIETARKLAQENGYFMPLQFQNPANPEVHSRTTALEIVNDLDGRELHYFVAGVGTGGTISGAGKVLKQHFPNLKVVAAEPHDSPVLSGGKPGPHKIQGMGAGFLPEVYDAEIVDEIIPIKNEDAFSTAKCLAQTEGILCGISAGANVFAAMQVARNAGTGKLVVVVIPDTGERYISTDLFKEDT
jgi:cysteine synthase A